MKFLRSRSATLLFAVTITGCAASNVIDLKATPGEVFRQFVREREAYCRTAPPDPRDTSCRFLTVKPWSPNMDEESRFAHALRIPNPVPEDSGYRTGMTPDEYFNLLCSKEAGEFIYRVVRDVEGVFELRAREKFGTHTDQHLYEPEDPLGYYMDGSSEEPEFKYTGPKIGRYEFFERPVRKDGVPKHRLKYFDSSYALIPPADTKVQRFSGFSGDVRSMKRTFDTKRLARFGYTWRGIVRPNDREMGIAGSELIVLDLMAGEVLGVRRDFMQSAGRYWINARSCPQTAVWNEKRQRLERQDNATFVANVLVPKVNPGTVANKREGE